MRNKKFKELLNKLRKETLSRKSPHEIALGIGTGVFLGVFPVQGFKTAIVALIVGLYKKINLIALFTASTIFSLFPIVPFVYFFNYWVGANILNVPIICTVSSFKDIDFKMLGGAVGALFLGGTVIGIIFGVVAYVMTLSILNFKNKKSRRGVELNIKQSLEKIISGGQTGVDRAALDVALAYKIPCGGWCPNGRIAEDGVIPERYPLKETESSSYEVRTERNVCDSDGTLILNLGKLNGGTALTVEYAEKHKKPYLIVDLAPNHVGYGVQQKYKEDVKGVVAFGNKLIVHDWIFKNHIKILNIAGPRESKSPGIYKIAKKFLLLLRGSENDRSN